MVSFLLGTLLAVYRYRVFNTGNFLLMLVSLIWLDMKKTDINKYMDFKNAEKNPVGYEKHMPLCGQFRESRPLRSLLFFG